MKTALTVDDSRTIREMVSFTLQANDFNVLEAGDGKEALDIVARQCPDVIITDLNMPNMDGLELIRSLRKDLRFKFTPILMLTTESDSQKKQQGKDAGATGWIVKPFQPEKLIQIINKVTA